MGSMSASGGSRRLPLRSLVRLLTAAVTLAVIALVVLLRAVPLTGRTTLVVGGPSMSPAIGIGSAIVLEPVDAARLAVGDVVSIQNGPDRAIYTHRIVRVVERDGGPWLETKGDANAAPDPAIVPAPAVLGRVIVAIPYAGYLVALGSRPSGVVLLLGLAMALLLVGWILDPGRTASTAPQPA